MFFKMINMTNITVAIVEVSCSKPAPIGNTGLEAMLTQEIIYTRLGRLNRFESSTVNYF